MKTIIPILVSLLLLGAKPPRPDITEPWSYDGSFHEAIEQSDRVVIVDNISDSRGGNITIKEDLVLSESQHVSEFNKTIEIRKEQERDYCMCSGYPKIQWFKKDELLAQATLHHGLRVRSDFFPGDAELTEESSIRILKWMLSHGYKGAFDEFEKELKEIEANQAAHTTPAIAPR